MASTKKSTPSTVAPAEKKTASKGASRKTTETTNAVSKATVPDSATSVKAAKAPARKKAAAPADDSQPATPAAPKARKSAARKAAPPATAEEAPRSLPVAPPKVSARSANGHADSGVISPAVKRPAVASRPGNGGNSVARVSPVAPGPETPKGLNQPVRVDLPTTYGRTKVSVLVRDAQWLYVFWEIADATRAELGLQRGNHQRVLVLRVYDVTDVNFDGANAHSFHDVPVNDYTSSWYVNVPRGGRSYLVDLGVYLEGGRFQTITRSNPTSIPTARISEVSDPVWNESDNEVYHQILLLSGGADINTRLNSEELVNALQQRLIGAQSAFSGAFSGSLLLGSETLNSESFPGRQPQKDRSFWLEVGVEVIVYGATEPDAKVKFMGRDIQLTPEGTFRTRMVLPDGRIDFPVEATSSDALETRYVCPVVSRKTY